MARTIGMVNNIKMILDKTQPVILSADMSSSPASDSIFMKLGLESAAYMLSCPATWGPGGDSIIFSISMDPPVNAAPAPTSSTPAMAFCLTILLLSLFNLRFIFTHMFIFSGGVNFLWPVGKVMEEVVSNLVCTLSKHDNFTNL